MNAYRNINRDRIQFDFLVFRSSREFYEDEIESLGGHIYHVPIMEGGNFFRRRAMLDSFFKSHSDYAAVHCHMAALGNACLSSAERHGIPIRLAHSHIADYEHNSRGYIKRLFEKGFGNHATTRLACSEAAGRYMYGKSSFEVLKNGIDTRKFAFDLNKRKLFRSYIHADTNEPLIGHVGRFELMKNHDFLIDAYVSLLRKGFPGRLLLAGDGSLKDKIRNRVLAAGIEDRVIFLGVIEDTPAFYSGIDAFIMPSLFEGLPFSAIEAQCSGLPCILSETITKEVRVTENVTFLPIDRGASDWTDAMSSISVKPEARIKTSSVVRTAGYDIKDVAILLQNHYERR